jgi:beta-glucosidase
MLHNQINGDFGCENSYTLRDVLKDCGFKRFVISDYILDSEEG